MNQFGKCKIDNKDCYARGAICRLNPTAGFQTEYSHDAGKQIPFRNKNCTHFKKEIE